MTSIDPTTDKLQIESLHVSPTLFDARGQDSAGAVPPASFALGTDRLADGVVVLTLTAAQTRELLDSGESVRGRYDAEAMREGDAEPTTWIEGPFRVRDDVTKEGPL